MAILVGCSGCGRKFRAKDEIRNARVKCPGCKADVIVQGPHVCSTDVFISHSSADKQLADAACAALESKSVTCWIAPRDIPAGASWGASIVEGIEDSRVMLLVFSVHANKSDQVLREVERAVAKKKAIVPLRIDAEPMRKDFEYFLASCHWVDVTDGALESHLDALSKRVRRLLLDRAQAEADQAGTKTTGLAATGLLEEAVRPPRQRSAKPLALAAAVALVLAALGVFYAKRQWGGASGNGFDSSSSSGAASQPISSPTTAPQPPQKIDLLAGVVLPRDVVSGTWKKTDAGLEASGDLPMRLRFTNPPAGDYDVRVTFTPTFGVAAVGIVLTRNGKNFVYAMGNYRGAAFNFDRHNKLSRVVGPCTIASLTNNQRHMAVLKVRKNAVTATVDGNPACQLLTSYADLDLPPPWRVGGNVLGIASYRYVIIHSAECVGMTSAD